MKKYALSGPYRGVLRLRGLLFLSLILLLACGANAEKATNVIEPQSDGTYAISGPDYRGVVSTHGLLESLEIGGTEFLGSPLLYGNTDWRFQTPGNWRIIKAEQPKPDTLTVTLASPAARTKPLFGFTYVAAPEGLHLTLNRLADDWGGQFGWRVGVNVIGVESLARPGFGFKRLPGEGVVYALPVADAHEAVRDMRYYLANGRALDVTYFLYDAGYNRQSNGLLYENGWGRQQISRQPIEFVFAPVRGEKSETAHSPRLRTLPKNLRRLLPLKLKPESPEAMVPVGKPAGFLLHFEPKALPDSPQTLTYRLLNFWDKETDHGTVSVTPQSLKNGTFRFEISPKQTGWFRLIASLRSMGAPDALPSEDAAEFGVFTQKAGMVNPPLPTIGGSGIVAALGLRCVRDSFYLTQFFPTREKSPVGNPGYDWKSLDETLNPFFEQSAKYGVNAFCQMNVRPDWADPANFEALIKAIVTRYKARIHTWEIENEPQDRYKPEDYVTKALAPAFRGAHAADPGAVVMGPAIVRVDLPWFTNFFKAGGASFLDAVSTHSYTGHNRSWEEHGNAEDFRALRELMKANGAGDKPLWQTEEGFLFDNHAEMPRLHAAYIVRMFTLADSVGIPPERCSYFYPAYNGFEPWYLYDRAPNRSGMATRILAEQTAGMKFDHEIPMGKYAHAMVYTNGKQDVTLLWTDDFSVRTRFQIPAAVTPQIADIMGVPIEPERDKKGVLTLTLDGFPRYLRTPRGTAVKPLDRYPAGVNYAAAAQGGVGEASSFMGSPQDAANLNDGTWRFDDGQTDQKIWVGKANAELPQWAAVMFRQPQKIDTIVAVTPSANVGLPGARHFLLQVEAGGEWKTVREVKDNVLEWALYAHFPPVVTGGVRVVIQELNNGWWREDKMKFTDMAPRVYELEAYGPERHSASIGH